MPTARAIVVFVVIWAIGLTALATIVGVQSRVNNERHAQAVVESIRRHVEDLAIASFSAALLPQDARPTTSATRVQLEAGKQAIRGSLPTLTKLGEETEQARIGALVRPFFLTVDRVAALVGRGSSLQTAIALSRARQPLGTYGALLNELNRANTSYSSNATRSRLIGSIVTASAIVSMLLAFSVSLYRATRLAHDKHELFERARVESLTDALTGLPNRRKLFLDLESLQGEAPPPTRLALAMFDLNGFKIYNDTFGHPAGDALLARFGHKLAMTVAGRGSAYRMGGDEFCVIARGRDLDETLEAAAEALSERGDRFHVTCSRGSAQIVLNETSLEQALQLADQRLYTNKRSSRPNAGGQPREQLRATG